MNKVDRAQLMGETGKFQINYASVVALLQGEPWAGNTVVRASLTSYHQSPCYGCFASPNLDPRWNHNTFTGHGSLQCCKTLLLVEGQYTILDTISPPVWSTLISPILPYWWLNYTLWWWLQSPILYCHVASVRYVPLDSSAEQVHLYSSTETSSPFPHSLVSSWSHYQLPLTDIGVCHAKQGMVGQGRCSQSGTTVEWSVLWYDHPHRGCL